MAERKSGPVRPPVIDLKARDAETAATPPRAPSGRFIKAEPPGEPAMPKTTGEPPAEASAPDATGSAATPPRPEAQPAPPPPPRPQARLAMPWSAISIAALGGALLGTLLTYLVANWLALPQQAPAFADPAPRLAEQAAQVQALDERIAAAEQAVRDGESTTTAGFARIDAALADLRGGLDAARASLGQLPPGTDFDALRQDLQTLEGRIGAMSAGASSADATQFAQNLAGIEQTLAALDTRLAELDGRVAEGAAGIAGLRTSVEDTRAALAAQSRSLAGAEIGPAVKLPLLVSGLESAFANGRPYAAELGGLTALLPDLAVPAALASAAPSGLARPDALLARFESALPAIIAGRAATSTGDWTQDALEWAKALLALRPAEEMAGDTPEAIVSRLEGAMTRRDFVAAAALLAQLPPPMRNAAGDVGRDVAALAEAETFVTRLRTEALSSPDPATPTGAETAP